MRRKKLLMIFLISILFVLVHDIKLVEAKDISKEKSGTIPDIIYEGHVQDLAWTPKVKNGQISGTVGQDLRFESIKIWISGAKGSVSYDTYLTGIGWDRNKRDGEESGTTYQSRAMEAIRISISGEIAKDYDIYYRLNVEKYGWLGWTSNGKIAGTLNGGLRAEAIQIQLVPKANFSMYLTGSGWSFNGNMDGISDISRGVEALRILTTTSDLGIQYNAHADKSWLGWMDGMEVNFFERQIDNLMMRLTGGAASRYDIIYSTYMPLIGWSSWARNGEICNLSGLLLKSLKVLIVPKGADLVSPAYIDCRIKVTNQDLTLTNLNDPSILMEHRVSDKHEACALCAVTMMLRRKSFLLEQPYKGITEKSVKQSAWLFKLKKKFTYNDIRVTKENLKGSAGQKKEYLISLLSTHQEGIVLYDSRRRHAILLTDYNVNGGTFYIIDLGGNVMEKMKLENSTTIGNNQTEKLIYIDAIWYVNN